MGPVLIDVPMDIQQLEVGEYEEFKFLDPSNDPSSLPTDDVGKIKNFFKDMKRPLVLFGAGVGLSGSNDKIIDWINKNRKEHILTIERLRKKDYTWRTVQTESI